MPNVTISLEGSDLRDLAALEEMTSLGRSEVILRAVRLARLLQQNHMEGGETIIRFPPKKPHSRIHRWLFPGSTRLLKFVDFE